MEAIRVSRLTKLYGKFPAIADLDLSLASGRIVGLMGENGSGKTTLLKVLAGVLAEYSGEVQIAGLTPGTQSKAVVSYLPDASYLPDTVTPDYTFGYFGDFYADFDADKARGMLEYFGLKPKQQLKTMSKGMREKLQIALVMSRAATVYLLDEPISGVDPAARETILNGIITNFSPDGLMVISTHLITDVENVVDEVVFLRGGRVLLHSAADDLRAQHNKSLDQIFREMYACMPY